MENENIIKVDDIVAAMDDKLKEQKPNGYTCYITGDLANRFEEALKKILKKNLEKD